MKERSSHRRGFTLVELLVVLAIVGFIVVLSIPMVGRLGLLGGSQQELAGRELFTLLRAAKIYATTYNVETALAYSVLAGNDSETDARVPYIDSIAIVRRLKPNELRDRVVELDQAALTEPMPVDAPKNWFVPLRDSEGRFKRFTGETCILNDPGIAADFVDGITIEDSSGSAVETSFDKAMAMDYITLYDEDTGAIIESVKGDLQFPAHVFGPSGAIVPDSDVQRIPLRVGLRPDASPDERFFIDPETGQFEIDENGERRDNAVVVSLYTALGRVKMSS